MKSSKLKLEKELLKYVMLYLNEQTSGDIELKNKVSKHLGYENYEVLYDTFYSGENTIVDLTTCIDFTLNAIKGIETNENKKIQSCTSH